MILYQVKNLDGEVGENCGYYEYEFCIYISEDYNENDVIVQFAKNNREPEDFTDRQSEGYSVKPYELNLIGEF